MMMKMVALTFVLLCFGYSYGFNQAPSLPQNQSEPSLSLQLRKQKFLFESSYTNHAWGYQHDGIYIDNQGNVYRYAYQKGDKPWLPQSNSFTEQELEEKYSHGRKLVKTIDSKELLEKYRLIGQASKERYSKRLGGGADQGAIVSSCYVYDEATGSYKAIELGVEGDWTYENLSPVARELAEWLESLSGRRLRPRQLNAVQEKKADLKLKVIDRATKKPIRNTAVEIYSDNGIRCVQAPCPTNGIKWGGTTDAHGVINVPGGVRQFSMTISATGYSGRKDLIRESKKNVGGMWIIALDADGRPRRRSR